MSTQGERERVHQTGVVRFDDGSMNILYSDGSYTHVLRDRRTRMYFSREGQQKEFVNPPKIVHFPKESPKR